MFLEFGSAYTISNESQRWATSAVPNIHRVLTVAGSGDQAIFYKLAGAKIVDTFDITHNAGVVQNIKYAAIKKMDTPDDYKDFLVDLFYTTDVMSMPQMKNLKRHLTKYSRRTIDVNSGTQMFCTGLDANAYPENIPTDSEFEKLKTILNKPFRFIQSDLENVHAKIHGKYDLINLSNIFDYCYDGRTQAQILISMAKHLNVGGHIVYLPQMPRFKYTDVHIKTKSGIELNYQDTKSYRDTKMILFQRTR